MAALSHLAMGTPYGANFIPSGMGKSTARKFIPDFLSWFDKRYFNEWVAVGDSVLEIEAMEQPFRMCGLPGCIAGMDGVHVAWDNCPAPQKGRSTSYKGYTTLGFNVCCTHNKRIISVAGPFFGANIDKKNVRRDNFMDMIREKRLSSRISTSRCLTRTV